MYSEKLFKDWLSLHNNLGQMFKSSSSTLSCLIKGSIEGYKKWDQDALNLAKIANDYKGYKHDYIMLNFKSIEQIFSSIQKYCKETKFPISDNFISSVKDIVFTLAEMLLNFELNKINVHSGIYNSLSDSNNIADILICMLLECYKGKEPETLEHKKILSRLECQQLRLNFSTPVLNSRKKSDLESESKRLKINLDCFSADKFQLLGIFDQTKSSYRSKVSELIKASSQVAEGILTLNNKIQNENLVKKLTTCLALINNLTLKYDNNIYFVLSDLIKDINKVLEDIKNIKEHFNSMPKHETVKIDYSTFEGILMNAIYVFEKFIENVKLHTTSNLLPNCTPLSTPNTSPAAVTKNLL